MAFLKTFLKRPAVRKVIARIAAAYISLVFKTTRWQHIGLENFSKYWTSQKPVIICFWHNRLLMMCFAWRAERPFHMLISSHRDGEMIARTVGYHGIKTIPGSTSKGSMQALRLILKNLKEGSAIGITPDGPRGPKFKVGEGVINIAKLSGADIVPITYAVSRRKVFSSWDRFVLSFPFGKGVYMFGDPIKLPKKIDKAGLEKARQVLEKSLTELSNQADAMMGHAPIL
jgi:lysophospholipid acyltransferase (LPLAT)-like uncharacterized protein